MLVRMVVGLSGPTMTLNPGDERAFSQDEAVRLIKAGYAVPVAEAQIERAVVRPVTETRVLEMSNHHRKHKRR